MGDAEEQQNELLAIESIYGRDAHVEENERGRRVGKISILLEDNAQLPSPVVVRMLVAETLSKAPGHPSPYVTVPDTPDASASNPALTPLACSSPASGVVGGSQSQSGAETSADARRVGGGFRVVDRSLEFLPPIVLNFEFPEDYPSAHPPSYTLTCPWLTPARLSKLCAQLDALWSPGTVVLFTWAQWLKDSSVAFLHLQFPLILRVSRPSTQEAPGGSSGRDPRAIQDAASVPALLQYLVEYDRRRAAERLAEGEFLCEVCYETKPGTSAYQFAECRHVYCRDCMSTYFASRISEGDALRLRCPHDKCNSTAPANDVRALVSPALYEKYDALLLQHTLNEMGLVVSCPRPSCKAPVIVEKNGTGTMAVCSTCGHVFCTICERAWHGVSECMVELSGLLDRYVAASPEEKARMEKQYGKRRLEVAVAERDTKQWLNENSKPCPRCHTAIEKTDGCNKMECRRCHAYFCWLCLRALNQSNPYDHYSSGKCSGRLFEGVDVEGQEWNLFGMEDGEEEGAMDE